MEERTKTVDTTQLMESYRKLLSTADLLPLGVTGGSMLPFLAPGRDTVYLSHVDRPLKTGDMALYQRDSGAYILHRVCRVEDGTYCMAGDAQTVLEHGIRREQVFAVVRKVRRKGKIQAPGCFWWEFFEKIWVRVIPLRPAAMRIYGTLTKLFRRHI